MKIKKLITFETILSITVILLMAGLAYASEGGEGGHEASLYKEYAFKIINFAILVFILVKFMGKPVKSFLQHRTEVIEKSLNEARQARELAEKALKEVEERLRNKDEEIKNIIAQATMSGQSEKESIEKEAERMSAKILEQARANIDFEVRKAKDSIKQEAVELAMELAEKKIREKLSDAEKSRLLEESLTKLEGGN